MIPTPTAFLLALGAAPAAAQELPLAPACEPGAAVRTSWSAEHRLVLDQFTRHGKDGSVETLPLAMRLESSVRAAFVDHVIEAEGGRPTVLRRVYEPSPLGAVQRVEGADPLEVEVPSAMAGCSVVFTWVAEDQEYGRYYDAAELQEPWLPGLGADARLAAFLPPGGSAAPGASWTVPAGELRDVLALGGDLRWEELPKERARRLLVRTLGAGVGGPLHRVLRGESSGTAQVTFAGLVEDAADGRRLARLVVVAPDLRYLGDISDYADENRLRAEDEAGLEGTSGNLVLELAGRGELLWDLDAGRAHSLELSLTERVLARIAVAIGGAEPLYEDRMQMSGRVVLRAERRACEAPPPAPGPRGEEPRAGR